MRHFASPGMADAAIRIPRMEDAAFASPEWRMRPRIPIGPYEGVL